MLNESRLQQVVLPGPAQNESVELSRKGPGSRSVEAAGGVAYRARIPIRTAQLREAAFDDYAQIVALQERNGLTARSYSDWSALWTSNPAYLDRPLPLGWVLEDANGEIGAYLGNLPLRYQFGGRVVHAATDYSWVVDAAHRGRSIELLSRFLKQPQVELFVCTTPNSIAEKILRAFQFSRANSGRWDQAGFWITGYHGFASTALQATSTSWPRGLAYPLAAGLFAGDAFRSRPRSSGGGFELCSGFDARFGAFWEELKRQSGNCLLADRSRAALNWHFGPAMARGDAWVLGAAQGTRLVAYAIFDRQNHPALNLTRVRITDFQALRGFEELLNPALHWVLKKCRKEGIHLVENSGCWLERFGVARTAPHHHRRLQCWQFYYKTRDPELFRQLQDAKVWAPSSFDGDASL